MKLSDWQIKNSVSNVSLAEKINVHFSYITHIKKGRKIPSPTVALAISNATGGEVSVIELLYPNDEKAA